MIRVASYNIRKAVGTDRRRRPDRIVEVLGEIDADIVALQEADRRFGARLGVIPLAMLAEDSDYKAVPFDIRPGGLGWHGNAILIRKSAKLLRHEAIHLPSLEPRGAVLAEIAFKGMTVRVIGMHLDLSGLWRRQQALSLLHHVEHCETEMPTILMGDTNEWSAHGGALRDFARHYSFADCGKSFHARRPVAALDRIMVSEGLRVVEAGVHMSQQARKASDHLPVWAGIQPA